jgi:WD40 repeat protein
MRSGAWAGAITFAGDGERIASGDAAGVIQVWDIGRRQVVSTLEGHAGPVTALARMADGTVLSGGADGRILRWDLDGGGPVSPRADCHRDCVSGIAVHPAGRRAVSAGHDGEIRMWSLPDGKPLGVFAMHGWKCMSAAFTPDGQQVVSAGTDGKVRLWDWPSGRAVTVLAQHENPVNWVVVTGDGRHVLSASDDATIRAWNLRTGDEERCWRGHRQGIRCVALTPGDNRLVSVSVDGTVRIWDQGGRQLFCHDLHRDWVNGVAVTLDGRYALSVSDSPAARLVLTSIDTGEPLLSWQGHAAAAFAVARAAASSLAVTAGLDGRVRLWDMSAAPDRMPSLTCEFTAGEELYACAASTASGVVIIGTRSGRVHTLIRHEGSGDVG